MKPVSILCMVLMLLLAGCLSNIKQPATETSISTLTTTKFTITPTFASPTIPPTLTRAPTQLSPTQTPFPTLTSDEVKTKLFKLLLNNGDCNLPCLLGYSPGISTRQDIQSFFNQFRARDTADLSISRPVATDRSIIGFYIRYRDNYLNMGVSSYEDKGQIEAFRMGSFSEPQWDPLYAETMKYYSLPQILTNYGTPSQVLVLTFRNDRQRPDVISFPFFLLLIYQEQGFYLQYKMVRITSGIDFKGCPSESFASVATWSAENNEAYEKMMEATVLGNYLSDYRSISDATGLTLEEFYQAFSNPQNQDCIATPIETWPNP